MDFVPVASSHGSIYYGMGLVDSDVASQGEVATQSNNATEDRGEWGSVELVYLGTANRNEYYAIHAIRNGQHSTVSSGSELQSNLHHVGADDAFQGVDVDLPLDSTEYQREFTNEEMAHWCSVIGGSKPTFQTAQNEQYFNTHPEASKIVNSSNDHTGVTSHNIASDVSQNACAADAAAAPANYEEAVGRDSTADYTAAFVTTTAAPVNETSAAGNKAAHSYSHRPAPSRVNTPTYSRYSPALSVTTAAPSPADSMFSMYSAGTQATTPGASEPLVSTPKVIVLEPQPAPAPSTGNRQQQAKGKGKKAAAKAPTAQKAKANPKPRNERQKAPGAASAWRVNLNESTAPVASTSNTSRSAATSIPPSSDFTYTFHSGLTSFDHTTAPHSVSGGHYSKAMLGRRLQVQKQYYVAETQE